MYMTRYWAILAITQVQIQTEVKCLYGLSDWQNSSFQQQHKEILSFMHSWYDSKLVRNSYRKI